MFARSPLATDLFFRWTELDRASYAEFRDRIARVESEGVLHSARSYEGFPRNPLPRAVARVWPPLDRALSARRSVRDLSPGLPSPKVLGRLLQLAHGVNATLDRGPVPSGGGLQALELYVVVLEEGWLAPGAYHYDRRGHHLSLVARGRDRAFWADRVPSTMQFRGGALLWIIVGDGARVEHKYGPRGQRFLFLEAGHLMQNLCLLSATVQLCTLPLGGFFEAEIARELQLPKGDTVLYVAACGGAQPLP